VHLEYAAARIGRSFPIREARKGYLATTGSKVNRIDRKSFGNMCKFTILWLTADGALLFQWYSFAET
jgi:hypothetical protein